MRTLCAVLFAGLVAGMCPAIAVAQGASANLREATLEELMDIRVTSAARKSQQAKDVPAAIYVITQRDIRQSGLATLPEILRLAPGVQVAQVSASNWAISIRGFNDLFSNKLLVLVDGRSIYNRTFSGVFWGMQDVMVADIDRVEIIRGPGGAVWGANAVNGVINIITRPATDTQGLALDLSAGTFARERVGIRYGGTFGRTAYRAFAQWSGYADAATVEPTPFSDNWHSLTTGARMDWSRGADAILAQGNVTTNRTRPGWLALTRLVPGAAPSTDGISHGHESSVLGRWTRTQTDGTVLQVQAYHTDTHRDEAIVGLSERTSDIEAQYETRLGFRQGLVFGGGYRHVNVAADRTLTMRIGSDRIETFSAFLQDEIAVRRDLTLTLGSRLEHDSLGGWSPLPSARVMWQASAGQRLWTAVSSTRRTPTITDRDFRANFSVIPGPALPILVGVSGSPEYDAEEFVQAEAGYRILIGSSATLDAVAFSGSYDGLRTFEPIAPAVEPTPAPVHVLAGVELANLLNARMSGVELSARWTPVPPWQLEASYSLLHLTADLDPASLDSTSVDTDGNAPRHQWHVRSTISLRPGLQVGASISRVGGLRKPDVLAYTRLDARAELRLTSRLTAAAVAQNLLTGHHQEFASDFLFLTSSVPRSARLDLRWEF